jgi:hypothetical protein
MARYVNFAVWATWKFQKLERSQSILLHSHAHAKRFFAASELLIEYSTITSIDNRPLDDNFIYWLERI